MLRKKKMAKCRRGGILQGVVMRNCLEHFSRTFIKKYLYEEKKNAYVNTFNSCILLS